MEASLTLALLAYMAIAGVSVCEESQRSDILHALQEFHPAQLSVLLAVEQSRSRPGHFNELLDSVMGNARRCQPPEVERYSRVDGVCHNLAHPFNGAVLGVESRMFANAYVDGRRLPRTHTVDEYPLPSARLISQKCLGADEDKDGHAQEDTSQLVWQFGQFLSHDVTFVASTVGESCCATATDCDTECSHSDVFTRDGGCFPMTIPADDTFFKDNCMVFTRSFGVNVLGVREQVNGLTSYIDASNVYGSSQLHSDQLRLGTKGLLKTTQDRLLPRVGNFGCMKPPSLSRCPAAGEIRVNSQPALAAMHTMFHLEHNRIARGLALINSLWDDERLFQESRKIMIGIMQKIVYEDYLPLVLGNDIMTQFDLNGPFVYNENVDASVISEFATTAFRHGHSMVNTNVLNQPFSHTYHVPILDDSYVKNILHYQAANTALKVDNLFTDQVRDLLFKNVTVPGSSPLPGPSFDLAAINIQRGRDHGIPPYPVVRDACHRLLGLRPEDFEPKLSCKVEDVYRSLDDLDLFVGGVAEKALNGSLLGPTFACLTAIQFQRLRFGDRFFYEGDGIEGFTSDQRKFIKRNSLASFLCAMDHERYLQRDVFKPVSRSNPAVPCNVILRDRNLKGGLNHWKEGSKVAKTPPMVNGFDL